MALPGRRRPVRRCAGGPGTAGCRKQAASPSLARRGRGSGLVRVGRAGVVAVERGSVGHRLALVHLCRNGAAGVGVRPARRGGVGRGTGRGDGRRGGGEPAAGVAAARSGPPPRRRLAGDVHQPQLAGPARRGRSSGERPLHGGARSPPTDRRRRSGGGLAGSLGRRREPHRLGRSGHSLGRRQPGGSRPPAPAAPERLARPISRRGGPGRGRGRRHCRPGLGLGRAHLQPEARDVEPGVGPDRAAPAVRARLLHLLEHRGADPARAPAPGQRPQQPRRGRAGAWAAGRGAVRGDRHPGCPQLRSGPVAASRPRHMAGGRARSLPGRGEPHGELHPVVLLQLGPADGRRPQTGPGAGSRVGRSRARKRIVRPGTPEASSGAPHRVRAPPGAGGRTASRARGRRPCPGDWTACGRAGPQ